ncbi:PIN domain-containing protein [Streptomyces lichenis]|uniref:DNA-binding protein n=1 Tax=Streptomyces lichenis TaxID=2306967 RepID=A0ABT0ID07_9ACTN|nr:PIN domain-containing protein [Streptomyces lichenis]MCK8679185.1 DNA-binding protein [Streptomyces lichenis]
MTTPLGIIFLDSQGLSAAIAEDRKVMARLRVYWRAGATVAISANTIIEVMHAKVNMPRLNWLLSRIKVEPVTEQSARTAARLLIGAGLHGHKYAIDATVAEAALRQEPPVVMLTSDLDDMDRLCGERVSLVAV